MGSSLWECPPRVSTVARSALRALLRLPPVASIPGICVSVPGSKLKTTFSTSSSPTGLRVPGARDPFELSFRAILGQQISVARATVLAGALTEKFGQKITSPIPELRRIRCPAEALAASTPAAIAAIGMPGSRARTITPE